MMGAGIFGRCADAPPPATILGARLKRHYQTTSFASPNRSFIDSVIPETLTEGGSPSALTTPHGNVAVGCLSTHGYDGGATDSTAYQNLLIFGGFKIPTDLATAPFDVHYVAGGWQLYVNPSDTKAHFFGGTASTGAAVSNGNVMDNAWHRFVAHWTNDGSAGVGKLWIDGTLQTTQQISAGNLAASAMIEVGGFYSATGSEIAMTSTGWAAGIAGTGFSQADIDAVNAYLAWWI